MHGVAERFPACCFLASRRPRVHFFSVPQPSHAASHSLEELLLPVLGRAYGYALRLVQNNADAEDLVQEAVLAAIRGFGGFQAGTNFGAWFFQIITNCFYAQHRRRKNLVEASIDDVPDLFLYDCATELGLQGKAPDPARALLAAIDREQIDQALQRLPEEFRTVAALYFLEDLTYAEIARIVNAPVGTVRSRLHRGRKLLQKHLWQVALDLGLVAGGPEGAE